MPKRQKNNNWQNLLIFAFVTILYLHIDNGQAERAAAQLQNPCVTKASCNECIQTFNCTWCMDPNYGDRARCFQHTPQTCAQKYIYNPITAETILRNEELTLASGGAVSGGGHYAAGGSYEASSSHGSSYAAHSESSSGSQYGYSAAGSASASAASGHIVQIKPQHVKLKLRVNEVHKLKVSYSQAEDYPVDLYYLMDLSKSMEDDKTKLSALGNQLSETMRNITSKFRLGFGSFVDKVMMPYVSTIPQNLKAPCFRCAAPYGFQNIMKLDTDTQKFSSQVSAAAVSGNLDAPEGGFDAIMQAIACRDAIGWREQARRLLVFSTDASFHYAGDGKLGGVITPNDGECHLDEKGFYTHSTLQDYPSISQINQKVKENVINIIFAVTVSQLTVYEKLVKHIEGSSFAQLKNDSSNVVELVRDEYNKISSSIVIKDNANSHVKITYYSSCLSDGPEVQTAKCDGLKVGNVVTFTAHIMVTSCPADEKDWNQLIQIYPVGINESLTIDLEMLCSCPCEKPGSEGYEQNSKHCKNHGTAMCGICVCDEHYFGRECECSTSDPNQDHDKQRCRADNTTMLDCSGRGTCQCGVCICNTRNLDNEIISGKFCECDNFSCERYKNLLCSGEDHGVCECGHCVCKPEWTGNACDCQASNHTCIPEDGGEICSGHGDCVCGQCKCRSSDEGRYSGKYCEKCPTCSGHCQDLKDCVQCQVYKTGPYMLDNLCEKCNFTPISVEKIELKNEEQKCVFYDEDDCKFTFKYSEDKKVFTVEAQQEKECPPKVFMLGIVLGVIAAIVLIGLAILLLWKLLTTIHDRREFARFEKERMNAKWDTGENPIYKQATSTFKNPTYGK